VGGVSQAQFVSRSGETQHCYGRENIMGCGFLKTDCRVTKVIFSTTFDVMFVTTLKACACVTEICKYVYKATYICVFVPVEIGV
jgi:hypothetical protein